MTSVIASCKATPGCSCDTCNKIRAAIRNANNAKKRACPLCKAKPGHPCVKGILSGVRRPPHAERYAA